LNRNQKIELHQSELDIRLGIDLKKISSQSIDLVKHLNSAHRDDHYIFFIQEKGHTELMIDFHHYILIDEAICYISPGQIHQYQKYLEAEGWFLFLETNIINNEYREILETHENVKQTALLSKENLCLPIVQLLGKFFDFYKNNADKNILISMINSLIGMIVSEVFKNDENNTKKVSRRTHLAYEFRKLVRENYLNLKKPKEYASLLNISVSYLNEVVKEQTGYAVSHWIKEEILLEAKRLLYYTQQNSKEIAFALQYEDYAYFSRFFKQNTGITPLEFRNMYLDLSNHYN
jgi:AraC-like DNA-binding protein